MIIKVYKMSGAGNLFSVIDNRDYNFSIDILRYFSPLLCKKSEANKLGTEGLIAINHSDNFDFSAEFFNPDGSHGVMCGNGGRCAVHFAKHFGFFSKTAEIQFTMADDNYSAAILTSGLISLRFPPPKKFEQTVLLTYNNSQIRISYVDVGSQHIVIDFNDLNINLGFRDFDLNKIARFFRFHPDFAPVGVNVNIYLTDRDAVHLRTYERGVEAETGACGTGAISTALVCAAKHNLPFPIAIIPPSCQLLSVDCKLDTSGNIDSLFLIGPAIFIDTFELFFDNEQGVLNV